MTDLETAPPAAPSRPRTPWGRRAIGLLVILAALAVALVASLLVGANPLPPALIWQGLLDDSPSAEHTIVWTHRMPRTVVAVVVGSAFGVAGAVIQALTRNPLADPGILGVNAGAGFAVTLGVALGGGLTIGGYVWYALLGAALATGVVYLVGAAGGSGTASPVTLVLAGVALAAVLGGITQLMRLLDPDTFDRLRFWGLGSVARTSLDEVWVMVPLLAAGLLLALAISGSLNSVALGEDLATALGTSLLRTRVLGVLSVTLLAGTGTALTGGIAFVGLMIPHVVRWFTGPDQRWIIAYSAIAAPVLVIAADVVGRLIALPGEIQVGVVIAVVGGPVLIALVRRRRASRL